MSTDLHVTIHIITALGPDSLTAIEKLYFLSDLLLFVIRFLNFGFQVFDSLESWPICRPSFRDEKIVLGYYDKRFVLTKKPGKSSLAASVIIRVFLIVYLLNVHFLFF